MKNYIITVKTLEGLEEVLRNEIREIGGEKISTGRRAVSFEGDLAMVYRANYRLRTALRVLMQVESFGFSDTDDFYVKCLKINWDSLMNLNQSFSVHSTVYHSEQFRNSMFASLKVKDAIADRFRQRYGKRPDVDTKNPDVTFHVHISDRQCTISLDSSGDSLHRRGYRQVQGEAPLSEVLAAGMILLSGWDGNRDFIDPMCGSGTLPIEAALIAKNIPPGKFRKSYSFMNWKNYNPELWEKIKEESATRAFKGRIYASDIARNNVVSSQANARSARVFDVISFNTIDFRLLSPATTQVHLIMNPPYGERVTVKDIESLYAMIGERLKHHFTGSEAWILSSEPKLMHCIGLKPSRKIRLLNGAIECSFQKYEIFEGRRNSAYQ